MRSLLCPRPLAGEGSSELQRGNVGEGSGCTPHPTVSVERPVSPSPASGRGHKYSPALSDAVGSSALWFLVRANRASGRLLRRVQRHGGANERLQRLVVDLVTLMDIDGAPHIAFQAGVEEA